jgi:thiaminase
MTPGTGVRGRIIAAVTARVLLNELRSELAPVEAAIRGHRYLDSFAAALPRSLERFTGEQYAILTSDRRSFAQLAVRFPAGGAGELFLVLAEGEGQALERLLPLAEQLGLDQDRLRAYEPVPAAQAYPSFVAWLALNGSRADVALAFLANLAAWGDNCARMAAGLRGGHDTAFFDFFAEPAPDFEERALAVAAEGLAAGDSPERARRAARFLQAYELLLGHARR